MTGGAGPIGVFDSGVGGLTVVGALLRRFPQERILYVADQAHVPYGGRPLNEVCGFASAISAFLALEGCKAIVMACNISSATALPSVSESLAPIPVLGVIAPAVQRAALPPPSPLPLLEAGAPPIGVLATEGTVRSGAYTAQILRSNPQARVVEVACPMFVPLVEADETESAKAEEAAQEYLTPLASAGCCAVILGCTHYPYLLPALRRAAAALFPAPVAFIDPADEMADALRAAFPAIGQTSSSRPNLLLTTGNPALFRVQAARFLPGVAFEVGAACWQGGKLIRMPRFSA